MKVGSLSAPSPGEMVRMRVPNWHLEPQTSCHTYWTLVLAWPLTAGPDAALPVAGSPRRRSASLAVAALLLTAFDLVDRAIHLARMLGQLMPGEAEVRGLHALLLATGARHATRIDARGRARAAGPGPVAVGPGRAGRSPRH